MDYQPKLLKWSYSTLLGAAIVVALLVLPGRAGAVDITQTANGGVGYGTIGPISGPAYLGVSDTLFGASGNTFLDHVTFTVAPGYNFTLTTTLNQLVGINSLTAQLWDGAGATQYATGTPFLITSTSPSILAPGAYDLRVMGTLAGSSGFFNASVNFNSVAAPIPEPETYAMMLAGLGLMGFVARRRKQKTLLA